MLFADHLTLDAPKQLKDGYLAVRAKTARIGHYEYSGREIDPDNSHGLRDADTVHVLRDENTVFDEAAARSFIGKPITDDHPHTSVTADNWKDHARGVVMGALRDGDYLAFDLLLTDAALIGKVKDGKREISNGYEATLEFGAFTAPDGTKCAARQASIAGNHCAIVDRARAGPSCSIGDAAVCEGSPRALFDGLVDALVERTYTDGSEPHKNNSTNVERQSGEDRMPHTLIIDGLQVTDVSDQAKAAIEKLQGQARIADEAKAKAEGDVAKLTTDKASLEAKVTTLEQQVKDSKLTPQQLRDAAKVYAKTVETAKKLAPTLALADDADEAAIRKAVVSARLGDAAKDWSDEQIAVSFDTLASQSTDTGVDPVRNALSGGVANIGDAKAEFEKVRATQIASLRDAYKPAQAA